MLLTEQEASTKRCQESFPAAEALSQEGAVEGVAIAPAQMVSVGGSAIQVGGAYSYARHTAPINCIGSGCMAWRWQDSASVADGYPGSRGYCGKAGRV